MLLPPHLQLPCNPLAPANLLRKLCFMARCRAKRRLKIEETSRGGIRVPCASSFFQIFFKFFFSNFFFFVPVRVELLTSPPLPFVAPARCRRHQWKATDRARITNEYLMTFYDPICAPSGIRYISQQRLASSVSIYFPLYIFFHFFTRSAVVRVLISPDLQPIRPFTREVRWRFCFTTSAPVGALWLPPFPRGLFIHWAVARSRGSYSIG